VPIALDATYSLGEDLSGVGVYCREILDGVASAHPDERFLWCYRAHRYLASLRTRLPGNCRRRLLLDQRAPGDAALFHSLNQRVSASRPRRVVTTFHDLFVLTAEYSTTDFRRRFAEQARQAAERSDLIIAVSQFTAGQIEELLGVDASRLRVIHHGVRAPGVPRSVERGAPMILHVGAVQHRKNIIRLVEAFERLPAGWKLALAGSFGFGAEEILARIQRSPRARDIDAPGYVSAAQLEQLYAQAAVLAFPSLDEGFGLPVLEAMARQVPVVTSNRSALPEVAGDAAVLIDPTRVEEIEDALRGLVEDSELRKDFIARGLARSAAFRWEDAVRKTWKVYEELGQML